jgi:lipocalin
MSRVPEIVNVLWVDSAMHEDGGWMAIADADHRAQGGPLECHTTAYLLHEDDDAITVASTWSPDHEGKPARCCGALTIPKASIKGRYKIASAQKARKRTDASVEESNRLT